MRVFEQKRGGWRGRWHAQNWWRNMEYYAFPRIGGRPVPEVNTADVLEILPPIWHVKAEMARAVRQRIRSVLEWAIAMDLRNDNPCDRVLPVLGPQNDIVTHRQALPHKDVAAAIETVRARLMDDWAAYLHGKRQSDSSARLLTRATVHFAPRQPT